MSGESEFDINKIPRIQEKLYIDAKIRENNIFWYENNQNRIFATFRFNTLAFPESGKRFFASKMSNSDSPHVFTPRGVISRKIFT